VTAATKTNPAALPEVFGNSQLSTFNLQQFWQHFDTLAETPDAVARLRNFVLSLAVRGHLLPQNTEDEKSARWKEFVAKFPQTKDQDEESPFVLPKSWRWVRLNDVADYAVADKVDPSEIKDDDWVLDLEEIEKDTSRIVRIASFAEKQSSSTKAKFLPGDVLYGKLRPYLNKVVVAPQLGFCTTEIVPIRSRGLIEPTYLCIFLRSPDFVNYANSKSYGMKMPRLGTDDAVSAWVAVPPPAEQRRIAAKVEELLALCDELEARQNAAREHRTHLVRSALDHLTTAKAESEFRQHAAFVLQHSDLVLDSVSTLRQAIVALALKGQLTRQDPQDESASELIRRIDNWRQDAIKNKRIRAPKHRLNAIESSELSHKLPAGWEWTRLGVIIYVHSGDGLTADAMIPDGIPVFGGNGINGLHNVANVHKETIVIGRVGFYCGSIHLTPSKAWVTDNAFITEFCTEAIDRNFLTLLLQGTDLKKREDATAQPVISGGKIYPIVVALPPLAEQKRIVAKVDELLRWCDALEARLTTAQTTAASLLDATLHKILEQDELVEDESV
jgi:type I restriction enzyme S subunit